jgi:predicted molibdopterin-dependent oxidoreductase YjgC
MVSLTINDAPVKAREGQSILEAAQAADIYIPTLCNHPYLPPFGGCRMCLVKVTGMNKYAPACTTPVAEGMQVYTELEELHRLRRNIMELILSEHPSSCIVCGDRELCFEYHTDPTKAGRVTGCRFCPVKNECNLYEIVTYLDMHEIHLPIEYRELPLKRSDPFIERDYNLCILCGRCVRTCAEIRGMYAIDFVHRGYQTVIGTAFDHPLVTSGCIFCGGCVDVCPTGALSEKSTKWGGTADATVLTTCTLCPAACSILVEVKQGRIMNVLPGGDGRNQDQLCLKGRFVLPALVTHPTRLTIPMVQKEGVLKATSWDEALAQTSELLNSYAANEIGVIATPWMTTEGGFLLQKMAREVLRTDNLGIASCMVVPAIKTELNASPKSLQALEMLSQADMVLIVGTDLLLTAPILLIAVHQAQQQGAQIAFVDRAARKIPLFADLHVAPHLYAPFLTAVSEVLENGGAGINVNLPSSEADQAATLANMMNGKNCAVIWGNGLCEQRGVENVRALAALGAQLDSPIIPTWDGGNVQGLLASGCFAEHGTNPAYELGNIRLLYTTQPLLDIPEQVEEIIAQDIYHSAFLQTTSVVLPAAAWTEGQGSVLDLIGCQHPLAACTPPPGRALADWEIIARLAAQMGSGWSFEKITDVAKEFKISKRVGKQTIGDGESEPVLHWTAGEVSYRGVDITTKVPDFDCVMKAWRKTL